MDSGPSSQSDGTGGEACLGLIPEDLLATREEAAGSQEGGFCRRGGGSGGGCCS